MQELVRYLLKNRMELPPADWTAQGFGFLRLRISETMRLHIWDSRLREAGVSDIHDHTQWAFTSHIISGSVINLRYTLADQAEGLPFTMAVLNCGIGGGMVEGSSRAVGLVPGRPELYGPGDRYHQEPDEIHRTVPSDGAVTLIKQRRTETGTARVFWPLGGSWGDAIPRQATRDEVSDVGQFALSIFNAAQPLARAA